jgi:hypothetical protein
MEEPKVTTGNKEVTKKVTVKTVFMLFKQRFLG